jgi:hypothetical protein
MQPLSETGKVLIVTNVKPADTVGLTSHIGEGGIPEPPTPPIAGADMAPQLSGDAPR